VSRPEHNGDGQDQGEPELVTEHVRAMACVLVVACTFRCSACAGRWVMFVMMVVVILAHLAATSTGDAMPGRPDL
jgi:hypothetical protein